MSETKEEKRVEEENIEKILNEVFNKASKNRTFELVVSIDGEGDATDTELENRMLASALGKAILKYTSDHPGELLTYVKETHTFKVADGIAHMVATFEIYLSNTIIREVFKTIQVATKSKNVKDLYQQLDSELNARLAVKNNAIKKLLETLKGLEKLQDDTCATCENSCRDKVEEDAFDDFMKAIIKMMSKN